jgi:hypothetical protein
MIPGLRHACVSYVIPFLYEDPRVYPRVRVDDPYGVIGAEPIYDGRSPKVKIENFDYDRFIDRGEAHESGRSPKDKHL